MRPIRVLAAALLAVSASACGGGSHARTTPAPARQMVDVDNNSREEVVVRFYSVGPERGAYLGRVEPNHRATFELPAADGQIVLQRPNGSALPRQYARTIRIRRYTAPAAM